MKKVGIAIIAGILFLTIMTAAIVSAIIAAVVGAESSLNNMQQNQGQVMIPIYITGTAKSGNVDLTITGEGINITGIKGELKNKKFTAKNKTKNGNMEMELPGKPAKLSSFSWMPQFNQSLYGYQLDHSSAQYIYNQYCTNDKEGFRKYGNSYLVALGSYYGKTIGQKYILKFKQKNGSTLNISAVLGDQKADSDTDITNRYHRSDGSVVEFIMAKRSNKNSSTINNKFGTLVGITKGSSQAKVVGEIKGKNVELTGDIDGVPLSASGTIKNGNVNASGILGVSGGTSAFGNRVLNEAVKYKGYPYVFGGTPPASFDCSALTMWCYQVAGVGIPRTAQGQYDKMKHIKLKNAKVGDLVFFTGTYDAGRYITHVGIYAGNNRMFHAGNPLGYADLTSSYYKKHLVCAGTLQ